MQKKFNLKAMFCIVFLMLLPLIGCILRMALDGKSIFDFYLAATMTNDEVFYYKYVEGILTYGHPQGFFGFNESRALLGGGTAWSPIISAYWLVLGKLLGWNYIMPVICNILVLSVALLVFGIVTKPSLFQTLMIGALYLSYGQITYYTLSGVPESIIYSLVILFMAAVISNWKKESGRALIMMWITAFLLTTMRPYYLVLFLVPSGYLWFKNRKMSILSLGVGASFTIAIYAFISKYLCAEYFGSSVLSMGINPEDFQISPIHSIVNIFKIFFYGLDMSFYWIGKAILEGNFQGRMILILFILFILLIVLTYQHKKEKKTFWLFLYFIGYFCVRYTAIIFLYNRNLPQEAVRHAHDFILISILLIVMVANYDLRKKISLGVMCAALIITQFIIPMTHPLQFGNSLNYSDQAQMQTIAKAKEELDGILKVKTDEISYNNTIIWVYEDQVEGVKTTLNWKEFYAVPAGMALSICFPEYIMENYDELKSPYIATIPNGEIDILCKENQEMEIYSSDDIVIYNIRW